MVFVVYQWSIRRGHMLAASGFWLEHVLPGAFIPSRVQLRLIQFEECQVLAQSLDNGPSLTATGWGPLGPLSLTHLQTAESFAADTLYCHRRLPEGSLYPVFESG